MSDSLFFFFQDLIASVLVRGCNVEWRDNVITIYLPEEVSLNE